MDNISGVSFGDRMIKTQSSVKTDLAAQSQPFVDNVTLSGDIRKKYISGLIFDRKKNSNIDQFFNDESMKATFKEVEPSEHFPNGGYMIEFRNRRFTGSMPLMRKEAPGRIIGEDEPGHRPFGRFIREQDGWFGEAIVESDDPNSTIHRSMMTTYVGDDGKIEMYLVELNRNGGGTIYRLDADAYLKDPNSIPHIVDSYVYPPQERNPQPPFTFHTTPKARELSTVGDFFGPGVPYAEVRRRPPNEHSSQGGWEVHIPNPRRMADIWMNLRDHKPVGYKSSSINEENPFCTWERVQGGWVNINNAKITPKNFGQIKSSQLKTTLGDDGSILMTLYEMYESGGGCVYEFDVGEYLRNPRKPPPILSQQFFEEGEIVDETKLRAEAMEKAYGPNPVRERNETIVKEDGWIIIGGVRLPIHQ